MTEKKEGKTIFEYIGINFESNKIKKLKKVGYLIAIGLVLGIIIDAFLSTTMFYIVTPLIMLLFILIKLLKAENKLN